VCQYQIIKSDGRKSLIHFVGKGDLEMI
jgi:hypothetical protein